MRVIDPGTQQLTNAELKAFLAAKGCETGGATEFERKVFDSLGNLDAAGPVAIPDNLKSFAKYCQGLGLTQGETQQLINLVPTTQVEVYLVVDQCQDRLSEDAVVQLLQRVKSDLVAPPPPTAP